MANAAINYLINYLINKNYAINGPSPGINGLSPGIIGPSPGIPIRLFLMPGQYLLDLRKRF